MCKLSLQVASVPEKEEGRAATVASQLEGLGKQQAREFDFHPSYNSEPKDHVHTGKCDVKGSS